MGIHFKNINDVPAGWLRDAVWKASREYERRTKKVPVLQTPDRPRKRKRDAKVALEKERKVPHFTKRVSWTVHQFRHRLLDNDNTVTKELQDSLVDHSIIWDDTPKEIEAPNKRQTQIGKDETEYTLITIEEI